MVRLTKRIMFEISIAGHSKLSAKVDIGALNPVGIYNNILILNKIRPDPQSNRITVCKLLFVDRIRNRNRTVLPVTNQRCKGLCGKEISLGLFQAAVAKKLSVIMRLIC